MSLPERLASIGPKEETVSGGQPPPGGKDGEPPDPTGGLMQRIVIIQRDEKGYGFTVSGDNPVFVASVKADGAASRAGVQQGDRIVKVNGTLVTNRNHMDVVKLIKSGSYVALALLGKRTPSGVSSPAGSAGAPSAPNIAANRDGGRVTAPQPVDPDKDRELQQQKINMTRSMYETAKEDFEKLQRQYVAKPSDKLHTLLLEKERTVKALENQFKLLTGAGDEATTPTNLSRPGSNRFSDSEHGGLESSVQSWASSLPATTAADLGSMSDSPHTSPSISPTPNDGQRHNGQEMEDSMFSSGHQDIIIIDDEDIHSEDDQANDPGPYADIKLLESRPAHMAILLNYLINNSDPAPVLFYIISDLYSRNSGSTKEFRKWAYEIYSTFVAQMAPLSIGVEDNIISQIDNILTTSASRTDNESMLKHMFVPARQAVQNEIGELLADFRNKRDLGMANFYGFQRLQDNMDKAAEIKVAEDLLVPFLHLFSEDNNRNVRDRDQATGWALATFLRSVGGSKSAHSATLDRVQTFMMKDKRSIKFPGSRSSRAKSVKGHQFMLQHCYVTTFCNFSNQFIWGVGYQMYQCQSCEMILHKQFVEEVTETCGGKQKKRVSKLIPVIPTARRSSSNSNNSGQSALSQFAQQQLGGAKVQPDASDQGATTTQPYPKEDDVDLAGLPSGHSVKSIINRYQELSSPTGPGPGGLEVLPGGVQPGTGVLTSAQHDRKASDLSRSGSLNNKGERGDRPARRAKSDVDVDTDMFRAINQSGSSSASSLSNRSVESPSQSVEGVNSSSEVLRALHEGDSDFEVEPDLPALNTVIEDSVLRKLKPKEKKRQEVINELFYTERNHLRNLKVLDLFFHRPMQQERGVKVMFELALALFPNMEEMIDLHETFVKDIKQRSKTTPVREVGDLLLKRFDGEAGEKFRKGCAEYCRNQAFALEALKKHTRKEPKLAQFLIDAESNPMCRRLQLKDLVPSQMQRLTKYPLLIDSLMKHTQSNSEEYKHLEQAHEKCKHILAYVNQAVKECENYHKLRDIQRKLDTRSIEANTDAMVEVKNLDLSRHKLIFDGPLTWKLRSHRTIDLHLLLFDDILVLLQKQDDKYVLKFQNTNTQLTRDEKYSHGPVLRLKNVLARNVATDKKSFFVVNMTEVGAQMYEFTAATSELSKKWYKLINEKVDEVKRHEADGTSGGPGGPATRSQSLNQTRKPDKIDLERSKTTRISRKSRSVRNPNAGSPSESPPQSPPPKMAATGDQVDGLRRTIGEEDDVDGKTVGSERVASELIQPEEVCVDSAVVVEAEAVRSPLDRLRENVELIASALAEQDRLVKEVLRVSGHRTRAISKPPSRAEKEEKEGSSKGAEEGRKNSKDGEATCVSLGDVTLEEEDDVEEEEGEEDDEGGAPLVLVARALQTNARCIEIVSSEALLLAQQQQQQLPQQQQQQQQQRQQKLSAREDIQSPASPTEPLSIVSQGSTSEAESSSTNSNLGLNNSSTSTTTSNNTTTSQSPQQKQPPPALGSPGSREQLKSMAAEMNTILTKLMGAMNVGAEERHRLRQELAEAQERLGALKELQRQMTESAVLPTDRMMHERSWSSQSQGDGSDIPAVTSDTSVDPSGGQGESAPSLHGASIQQQTTETSATSAASAASEASAGGQPEPEAEQQPVGLDGIVEEEVDEREEQASQHGIQQEEVGTTTAEPPVQEASLAETTLPKQRPETLSQQEVKNEEEPQVHHGIQQATVAQLEESVEDLTLTSTGKVTVEVEAVKGSGAVDQPDDDDDNEEDENNEMSVKDLPLPDVNMPVGGSDVEDGDEGEERDEGVPSSSRLLDIVDLDDDDSDSEAEGEGGPSSSVPLGRDAGQSVDTEIITASTAVGEGEEGNNNKGSSVDGDSTDPIEI